MNLGYLNMSWWKSKRPNAISYGAASHVGMVRSENQDAYGCFPNSGGEGGDEQLFLVADGMGGHAGGREASRTALVEVSRAFTADKTRSISERIADAFRQANLKIYDRARSEQGLERMGTTCTAMVLAGGRIYIGHVGDTRAYRIEGDQQIVQLTHDHTLVEEMRREGVLTDDEARVHPRRNTLTRAMGVEPELAVDVFDAGVVKSNQRFLLCSDGLADVSDEELASTVTNHPPQQASDMLVELANGRGGHDNVTVLVVTID